jgi:amino acid permease
MSAPAPEYEEKKVEEVHSSPNDHDIETGPVKANPLARALEGRHMQMIAIGRLTSLLH